MFIDSALKKKSLSNHVLYILEIHFVNSTSVNLGKKEMTWLIQLLKTVQSFVTANKE